MLGKQLKRGLQIFFIVFAIVAFSLIIYYYVGITSEIRYIRNFISRLTEGIADVLTSLSKLSLFVFIETAVLSIAIGVLLISLIYFINNYFLEKKNALIDELTGVYNRKAMNNWMKKEVGRAKRFNHPLSIAMIDVDHFKKYNDINGHLRGDWLLQRIAEILRKNTREIDFAGRYGGEEFIVILPETEHHNAVTVLERIRKTIENSKFKGGSTQPLGKVSISIGLITFHKASESDEMIKKADELLYQAKSSGRNVLIHKKEN